MQCPNCAGEIDVDARQGAFVVCPYCRSASILDREALALSGKMALLAPSTGPLFVGAAGEVQGRGFHVLGRLRNGYRDGHWDEWSIRYEDGTSGWIGEDEREFTVSALYDWSPSSELYETLRPGDLVPFPGGSFSVKERGEAIVEGGEGQLPFAIEPGETVPFLDAVNETGDGFLTIEFPPDETPRSFLGSAVKRDELHVEDHVPGASSLTTQAAAGSRKRVTQDTSRSLTIGCDCCGANLGVIEAGVDSLSCSYCDSPVDLTLDRINCPSCTHPVTLHGGAEAESAVCSKCETQFSISAEKTEALAQLTSRPKLKPALPIGSRAKFKGHDWRVAGIVRWIEPSEGQLYPTLEYLLYSKQAGYAWLSEYNGHWGWYEELMSAPTAARGSLTRKKTFEHRGTKWKVHERGLMRIDFVDGELPWVAQVGDKQSYVDAIHPPFSLSGEWTDSEIEWSRGQYFEPEYVAQAFDIPIKSLPKRRGVGAAQPYLQSDFRRTSGYIMAALALISLVLVIWSLIKSGEPVAAFGISAQDISKPWMSEPFEITEAPVLCKVTCNATVDNSWMTADMVLVDSQERAILEFNAQCSYYHGYEGGESWSEGSKKDRQAFVVEEAGTYRLLMQGMAGRGESADPSSSTTMQIEVRQGVVLLRYFVLLFVFCLGWLAWVWVPRWAFEAQRWKDD